MSGPRPDFRPLPVDSAFDLATTCGPAAWIGNRSPRHAWIHGHYIVVEGHADTVAWRIARQARRGVLEIAGEGSDESDSDWAARVLRVDATMPGFVDPVIEALAQKMPGLRPLSDGSIFDGLLTAIIGQSVSLASAAAAQRKLAESFSEGIVLAGRRFTPLPSPQALANASIEDIRRSGVTWKRAEGIHHIAREAVAGTLPTTSVATTDVAGTVRDLLRLPMVGRWTAESVVLWGVGVVDCYPPGDVALLRAARRAYERPDLQMRGLDRLSDQWQPARAIAARLLWTDLLGPAT